MHTGVRTTVKYMLPFFELDKKSLIWLVICSFKFQGVNAVMATLGQDTEAQTMQEWSLGSSLHDTEGAQWNILTRERTEANQTV